MAETVSIFVEDTQPAPQPVADVLISFFTYPADAYVTGGTTGATGRVQVQLDPGEYYMRFYRATPGYSVAQPQHLEILDAPAPPLYNVFQVSMTLADPPASADPAYCRVWGYLKDAAGNPLAKRSIWFTLVDYVYVSGIDRIYLGQEVELHTDADGYLEADLLRDATYEVVFIGRASSKFRVTMPDAASAPIQGVLFPRIASVLFQPKTLSLQVDGSAQVLARYYNADGTPGGYPEEDDFVQDPEGKLTITGEDGVYTVAAVATGTVVVTCASPALEAEGVKPTPNTLSGTLVAVVED